MSKELGYLFEKPTYITMLEKQQRIIDNMMRPYRDLSGMYSGIDTLAASLQSNNEAIKVAEAVNAMARTITESITVPVDQIYQSLNRAFDRINRDYSGLIEAMAPYNNIMNTQQKMLQTLQNAFGAYNWDSLLGIQKTLEPLLKNQDLCSNACTTLASALMKAFPEESFTFDDDFSYGLDGSITIDGTTYSEEEIPKAIEEQVQSAKKWKISDIKESYEAFKNTHALLFFVLRIAYVLLTFPPTVQAGIQFYQNATQEIRMHLNDWDKWYYINNEKGAAIYQEPSTESLVLMRATYSNAVRKTEDTKFWIKVQYPNPECEDEWVEGWIAKRNLIPYADVEFYGDDAVCDN